ncbi:MAG: hypothetical protein GXO35_04420 [Gammaproteobacteria bacterium]|nr:hypothetical protein [Gammaproteobacteria bacterium]
MTDYLKGYIKGLAVGILCASFSVSVSAQAFSLPELDDQWGEQLTQPVASEWVILSTGKSGGGLVKEVLTALEIKDLSALNIRYVSDISGMPSFITNWIALPKMQTLPFKIYLDKTGDATREWPRKEGFVSVFNIADSEVGETLYFDDETALKQFILKVKASVK